MLLWYNTRINILHSEKWKSRKICEGKNQESNDCNEENVEYRRKATYMPDDYRKRIKIFDILVGNITLFGAEI